MVWVDPVCLYVFGLILYVFVWFSVTRCLHNSPTYNPSNCEVCLYRRHLEDCAKLLGASCMTDGIKNLILEIQLHLLPNLSNLVLQYAFCEAYTCPIERDNNDLDCSGCFAEIGFAMNVLLQNVRNVLY